MTAVPLDCMAGHLKECMLWLTGTRELVNGLLMVPASSPGT